MTSGKTNNWRGRVQPQRGKCPRCSKKGLGPIKILSPSLASIREALIGRKCRYCNHLELT